MRSSSSAARGPVVSQPERSVSVTAAISSSPIAGGWKPSLVLRRVRIDQEAYGLRRTTSPGRALRRGPGPSRESHQPGRRRGGAARTAIRDDGRPAPTRPPSPPWPRRFPPSRAALPRERRGRQRTRRRQKAALVALSHLSPAARRGRTRRRGRRGRRRPPRGRARHRGRRRAVLRPRSRTAGPPHRAGSGCRSGRSRSRALRRLHAPLRRRGRSDAGSAKRERARHRRPAARPTAGP